MKSSLFLLAPLLSTAAQAGPCETNYQSQALLIGNSAYSETFSVPYAHNDVAAIRRFLIERLCFRPGNIMVLKDATYTKLRRWLGSESRPQGRLWDRARPEKSNIFVFYSGHGVPDATAGSAYLLPVDAEPNHPEEGYPLDLLMKNLSALDSHIGPDRQVTLVLDTCFSGQSQGGTLQQHSGSFTPKVPAPSGLIRFSAARADQLAYWHKSARLGLFTKIFLDGLNGAADGGGWGNGDGRVAGEELEAYLADEVTYQARRLHGADQSPAVDNVARITWQLDGRKYRPDGGGGLAGARPGQSGSQSNGGSGATAAKSTGSDQTPSTGGRTTAPAVITHLPKPRGRSERCSRGDLGLTNARICVTSVLDPQYGNRYGGGNLTDRRMRTAWVEGVRGHGKGQFITLTFDRPTTVDTIEIANGYNKSSSIFRKNSRVRTMTVKTSLGQTKKVRLVDARGWQTLSLPPLGKVKWIMLRVDEVYRGTKYKDTAISEIRLH